MQRFAATAAQETLLQAERSVVSSAWKSRVRLDQRQFHQIRDLTVEFPFEDRGTALVRLGATVAIATALCELVEPAPYAPKHGFVDFSVRLNVTDAGSGISSSLRHAQTPVTASIARLLDATIRQSRALDTESLCVIPGKKVWSIRVDVKILNDDGNVHDACVWAALAALQHYRRQELTIRGEDVIAHDARERNPVPLSLHHAPYSVTCAITSSDAGSFVLDPTLAETATAAAIVCVSLNKELQVCSVHKQQGCDVPYAMVKQCIAAARLLVPQIHGRVTDAIRAHEQHLLEASRSRFRWAQQRTAVGKSIGDGELELKRQRLE
jgi:exosome complex component RRP45